MSPDIPFGFERGLRMQAAVPWSSFYTARMAMLAHVEALRTARAAAEAAQDDPQPLSWASVADACGADAADALDVLRDAIARGRYPDDVMRDFNAHRLTFARWLYRQGYIQP